ncbi:DUF2834 domain-containing protein [Leptolyngbya sp. AN02str]|uniref:DUF2834 domain-containing protein n=1 Tax=Leptolyngbya sp. AN02str TaxID=3423363 RepID=UPI003D3153A6
MSSIIFALLWLGLSVYAFGFAPPNQPDTFSLIRDLSTGNWVGINPLIVALFNIMGVWPMVYACLMFFDGRGQRIRAYPFVLGSFGVGAFTILPYLVFRKSNPTFNGEKNRFLSVLDSRWTGVVLAVGGLILLGYGLTQGNWADLINRWQSDRFIHVMSLDFAMLCLLFPVLMKDDMARRGWQHSGWFWPLALLPFVGALAYLVLRPPIEQPVAQSASALSPSSSQ